MSDTIHVSQTPAPTAELCWQTGALGTAHGMTHCDRKAEHQGLHSWELSEVQAREAALREALQWVVDETHNDPMLNAIAQQALDAHKAALAPPTTE